MGEYYPITTLTHNHKNNNKKNGTYITQFSNPHKLPPPNCSCKPIPFVSKKIIERTPPPAKANSFKMKGSA